MATDPAPRLRSLTVRAVRVPMREPHQTASGAVAESPLVLTDALFDDGLVGHSIVFTYTPMALQPVAELIRNVAALVEGEPLAPAEIEQKLARRFRLLGTQGLVGIALAAIDMALWDALARSHRTSLVKLAGRQSRSPSRPTARSVTTASCARRKRPRSGQSGDSPASRPRSAIRRCRRTSPSSARCGARWGTTVAIMVDYNQCLTPVEAVQRMRVLDAEGLGVGRGADARARLRGTCARRPRGRDARSSAARTGGDRSTSRTRSTRGRRIT